MRVYQGDPTKLAADSPVLSTDLLTFVAQTYGFEIAHFDNLVFRENKLVAVLDFDFMGVRPRIDDLALPLHTLFERGMPLRDVQRLVDLYDAGCTVPLSLQERRALPHAMARMALCYLQYMMIPGDEVYQLHCRREFNASRGPACVWWLKQLNDGHFREEGFIKRRTTISR